jgi:hypothetical protein
MRGFVTYQEFGSGGLLCARPTVPQQVSLNSTTPHPQAADYTVVFEVCAMMAMSAPLRFCSLLCLTIGHDMETRQAMDPDYPNKDASRRSNRHIGKASRLRLAILLAAIAGLGFGLYRHFWAPNQPAIPANSFQIPISNPPIEPDRPDLLGE